MIWTWLIPHTQLPLDHVGAVGFSQPSRLRYYCNNHPLVSIWAADPMHPFDRRERLIVFICGVMMSFFVSGMSESIKSGLREDCRDSHGDSGPDFDDCISESVGPFLKSTPSSSTNPSPEFVISPF